MMRSPKQSVDAIPLIAVGRGAVKISSAFNVDAVRAAQITLFTYT